MSSSVCREANRFEAEGQPIVSNEHWTSVSWSGSFLSVVFIDLLPLLERLGSYNVWLSSPLTSVQRSKLPWACFHKSSSVNHFCKHLLLGLSRIKGWSMSSISIKVRFPRDPVYPCSKKDWTPTSRPKPVMSASKGGFIFWTALKRSQEVDDPLWGRRI